MGTDRKTVWTKFLRVPTLTVMWLGLVGLFFAAMAAVDLGGPKPVSAQSGSAAPTGFQLTIGSKSATARGSWWSQPAPLELADTPKLSRDEREAKLNERIAAEADLPPEEGSIPYADQSMGATVVRSTHQVLATVVAEDLPEYAQRLNDDARRALEMQVAKDWAQTLEERLNYLRWRSTETYRAGILWVIFCLFLACLCLHRLLALWGRTIFDSPLWGAKLLLWALTLTVAFSLMPGTEDVGYLLGRGVTGPLLMLLCLGLVGTGVEMASSYALRRYIASLARTQRYRLVTLHKALEFVLRLIIGGLVGLSMILSLPVNLAGLATGAGLVGASLTYICQDMIRDFLAGVNILFEDQFGLGDWVEGAGVSGQVEAFTLRATQIRCMDGSLFCAPNSELRRIKNQSKGWSQVDFSVLIDHHQPLEPALRILEEEVQKLAIDQPDSVIAPPRIMGAQEINRDGVFIRALLRTPPGMHWALKRELNRRICNRFESEGILRPRPPWQVVS